MVSLREQFLGNGDMLQKTIQLQNGVCTGKSHAGNEKQRTLSKQTLDIAMHIEVRENKRGRFRRVSKARIFDGHVLKIGVYAAAVMVTAYLIITSCISLLFSYFQYIKLEILILIRAVARMATARECPERTKNLPDKASSVSCSPTWSGSQG